MKEKDRPPIQIDAYGIKAKVTVTDSGQSRPRTWKDVAIAINGHLKGTATSVFGLIEDLGRGSRNLVRSLTGIPPRIYITHRNYSQESRFRGMVTAEGT